MGRGGGRYARGGYSIVCGGGWPGFQHAEGQRHAALVAEGEVSAEAVLGHPCGGGAGEPVGRGPAFQPDGLDVPQGKGFPQPGARRLEEGFLRGKVRCRAGGFVGSAADVQGALPHRVAVVVLGLFWGLPAAVQRERLPLRFAKHPRLKGLPVGPEQALLHPCDRAQVTSDTKQHVFPLLLGRGPVVFTQIFGVFWLICAN